MYQGTGGATGRHQINMDADGHALACLQHIRRDAGACVRSDMPSYRLNNANKSASSAFKAWETLRILLESAMRSDTYLCALESHTLEVNDPLSELLSLVYIPKSCVERPLCQADHLRRNACSRQTTLYMNAKLRPWPPHRPHAVKKCGLDELLLRQEMQIQVCSNFYTQLSTASSPKRRVKKRPPDGPPQLVAQLSSHL
ncbi:unnamed protein product [Rangifer tarandus platyrhynchus]|uniref:Uncharacterized protein n=1 Tax=Rangifer tarandus platyrhynchus TaxID=3082113 RepID=A0ABN8XM10_RANTA|nr:unnamed protein product [Rangifer tarandus platyrhynchus]